MGHGCSSCAAGTLASQVTGDALAHACRFAGVFLGHTESPGQVNYRRGKEVGGNADGALDAAGTLRNFSLTPSQRNHFLRNGFAVVPSRGHAGSNFLDSLYDVFANDLPVFLSADAVLHAFHATFDDAVTTLERTRLIPLLQTVLDGMSSELESVAHVRLARGGGDRGAHRAALYDVARVATVQALAPSRMTGPNQHHVVLPHDEASRQQLLLGIVDLDYYLTVARSLMAGRMQPLALDLLSGDQHSELAVPLRRAKELLTETRLLIKGGWVLPA